MESVTRSSATARRPRAGPIIVSCCSSASRCLSNTDIKLSAISCQLSALSEISFWLKADGRQPIASFLGFGWPELDAARQAARIVAQQVEDDLGNLFRRDLPVGALALLAA